MDRRDFLKSGIGTLSAAAMLRGETADHRKHQLPKTDSHYRQVESYVENTPVPDYHWASPQAYEAFRDMKVGIRVHWGIYSANGQEHESWPYLGMSYAKKYRYDHLYKTWNPTGFDADHWADLFSDAGGKMFVFTTKHHEGFCMFDTRTRVRSRANWAVPGGPTLESCDLAYSIMETPFRRDVVKEVCAAGRRRNLKVGLYFSHPDWYDADFRPYCFHPVQVPSAEKITGVPFAHNQRKGEISITASDPTPAEVKRMIGRHRAQLSELLTNYGEIDMLSLDMWLGPAVWPELRRTLLYLRKLQPNVMLRARGIGNYGDYFTPESFVPGGKEDTGVPWMVIYPLADSFSYDPHAINYKGAGWIVHNVVDTVAKGGGLQIGVGPDVRGDFHPTAVRQLREGGRWLKLNAESIYPTRPRDGDLWHEGENIRYTRSKDGRFIYAFTLAWPGSELSLRTVRPKAHSSITMLGVSEPLKWTEDGSRGLVITMPAGFEDPAKRPCKFAWAFRIQGSDRL
ncbi:MAG TPA: alpha-L-fucosidase [Bryobacteraceae bacterium]